MKPRWLPTIALLAFITLGGCAGMVDSLSETLRTGPWWSAGQAEMIRSRARTLEVRGDLAMALAHWRLVARVAIDRSEADREITRLEKAIFTAVRSHYQNGLAEIKKDNPTAARNHFLAALRLDPAFQPARQQIKGRFTPFPLKTYLTVSGDSPETIARKIFGDREKAFLVASFNDLPANGKLSPGTLLILPKVNKTPLAQLLRKQPSTPLALARSRLAANDFEGALALARQANAADSDVRALIHSIYLQQAAVQIKSGQMEAARQSLSMVPDGVAGKDGVNAKLRTALQNQRLDAEFEHARMDFEHGRYQQSLDRAETMLVKSPDNVDVRNLAAEARYRVARDHVDHRRYLEARKVLEKADQGHKASLALKETVRSRLVKLAQVHYRNGVKHFINEDLKAAITEWEMALTCNPDHEKARENIENARRLMQKIKTMP